MIGHILNPRKFRMPIKHKCLRVNISNLWNYVFKFIQDQEEIWYSYSGLGYQFNLWHMLFDMRKLNSILILLWNDMYERFSFPFICEIKDSFMHLFLSAFAIICRKHLWNRFNKKKVYMMKNRITNLLNFKIMRTYCTFFFA